MALCNESLGSAWDFSAYEDKEKYGGETLGSLSHEQKGGIVPHYMKLQNTAPQINIGNATAILDYYYAIDFVILSDERLFLLT